MDSDIENALKIAHIFVPHAMARRAEIDAEGGRFVHYTSAEAAIQIFKSKQVWMRNAMCMSDFREVTYGHDLLVEFFNKDDKVNQKTFCDAMDLCYPKVGIDALKLYDEWWKNNIPFQTYITSVSVHRKSEDRHGRLSMWRAFGRLPARAAIVMKPPSLGAAQGLNLLFAPVLYNGYESVETEIRNVISNVKDQVNFLKTLDRERICALIMFMLVALTVTLKHEGFGEEQEWRFIYFPDLNRSKHMGQDVQVIDGVPQIVYMINLKDHAKDNITGVTIPALLDKVIIGPSAYPLAMYYAFVDILQGAGITDAKSRVIMSEIPLRS